MDRTDAQLILAALRPGGSEVNDPLFAEALALAESDPKLRAWWEAQQRFDRRVAAKLGSVAVPKDLRDKILTAPKLVSFPPQWRHRWLLVAAALVALLCVGSVFWSINHAGPLDRTQLADEISTALGTTGPQLAKMSADHEELKAWLKAQNAPVGDMPPKFGSIPSIGCQKYYVRGHMVSLVCFTLDNGHEAHLFMIDKSAMSNPFDSHGPQYDRLNGWNVAMWSDQHTSFVLATDGTMDDLKNLL
jgi:hypothetical protein